MRQSAFTILTSFSLLLLLSVATTVTAHAFVVDAENASPPLPAQTTGGVAASGRGSSRGLKKAGKKQKSSKESKSEKKAKKNKKNFFGGSYSGDFGPVIGAVTVPASTPIEGIRGLRSSLVQATMDVFEEKLDVGGLESIPSLDQLDDCDCVAKGYKEENDCICFKFSISGNVNRNNLPPRINLRVLSSPSLLRRPQRRTP